MSYENKGRMISTGKLLIRPPELCGNYQESSSSKARETGEGNDEFVLTKYHCSYFTIIFGTSAFY
jgi:hypothetical protein